MDEAAMIKNSASQTARSVRDLHAQNRFCLTGTPVENEFKDLLGLLRFLRIAPFCYSDWFTTQSDKRRFEMLHAMMLRRHKDAIMLVRKHSVMRKAPMSDEEEIISRFVEELYLRSLKESNIDPQSPKRSDKHQLDDWLNKRISTTTTPLVWFRWPLNESTSASSPTRRLKAAWKRNDPLLKGLSDATFELFARGIGAGLDNSEEHEELLEMIQKSDLLNSGKFMAVWEIICDLMLHDRKISR